MSIHYESKMLNLQDRLEMSETSWNMLKAYEDFQTGKMDRDQLRRKIRLSPQNRASMTNTIIQLAENKTVLSKEDKYCSGIISAMAEMIKIGDEEPTDLGFFFLKFPRELRSMVYELYLSDVIKQKKGFATSQAIVPMEGKGTGAPCRCWSPPWTTLKDSMYKADVVKLDLAATSKQVREEVMGTFYHNYTFKFFCACQMGVYLRSNRLLKNKLRSVRFYWAGPQADSGISTLQGIKLKYLVVEVSKDTGKFLTAKEEDLRKYFRPQRGYHNSLAETRGFDELVALRGIGSVNVFHVPKNICLQRPESERYGLFRLLEDKVTRED